jgi:Tfp pilus assembly protein PilW
MKGFLLVELLIASTLSLILLLALTTCLTFFIKNYTQQQEMNYFYDQANIISKLLQQSVSNAGDLGCQIFQDPIQIEVSDK